MDQRLSPLHKPGRRMPPVALLALGAAACIMPGPPPLQPAPQQIASTLPPVEVIQRATAKLIALGFDIGISDATGGVVQSKMAQTPREDVTCRWARGTVAGNALIPAMTLSITTIKAGTGSTVTISSRVMASYPTLSLGPSASDCASTGDLEKQIVAAITAK